MTTHEKTRRKLSISEVTTISNSFEEDVKLYSDAGCQGIGVWGFKMEQVGWQAAQEAMKRAGLSAANCVPEINSILPYALSPEPADPAARVEAFLPNMERMAKLNPESVIMITGPQGDLSREHAEDICVKGFRRIGQVAADLGVTVAVEPVHKSACSALSLIWDVPGTVDLITKIDQTAFKILFDTWHLWDTTDVLEEIQRNIHLIGGVHVADWRDPTRGWIDRAFPGEGVVALNSIIEALERAGFKGFWDVEIFSDDGRFKDDFEGSLWRLPPVEIVRRATQFLRADS